MKKIVLFVCFLMCFILTHSQISVAPIHVGTAKKFEDGVIDKFKTTKTIFVLPESINKDDYNSVLSEYWTVTPYELVDYDEFNLSDYFDGNFSIAEVKKLDLDDIYNNTNSLIFALDVYFFKDGIEDKLAKVKNKESSKYHKEFYENTYRIARVLLFPKYSFFYQIYLLSAEKKLNEDSLRDLMYKEDCFHNLQVGFFKNYIQQVDSMINQGKVYWMYGNDVKENLKMLKTDTLYIPEYIEKEYSEPKFFATKESNETFAEVIEEYKLPFKVISEDDLNKKIISNEPIYYLRFARMVHQKFIIVVDGQTGEEIYKKYVPGIASKLNIQPRQIRDISETIKGL